MKKLKGLLLLIVAIAVCATSTLSISAYGEKLTFFVPGDVDGNKSVDISDVTDIQLHLAEVAPLSEEGLLSADFNGDKTVDIKDATDIQLYLAKLDYNCIVTPDDGYLEHNDGICDEIAEENKIEFEEVLIGSNTIFTWKDVNDESGGGPSKIALIESVDQFYSVFNVCSPQFDDEFFSENALVIWIVGEINWGNERRITSIGVKDNKLLIEGEAEYPMVVSPGYVFWHYFYKVKKSDISNVDDILCNINVTIIPIEDYYDWVAGKYA